MPIDSKIFHKNFSFIPLIGFLFGFFLPISTKISNILIVVFCVIIVVLFLKKVIAFQKSNLKGLKYSTLILLIPCLLSLFFYNEFITTLNIVGRRITFFVIPISLLFLSYQRLSATKKSALLGIVYGSCLACLGLLLNNFLNYYATRPFLLIDDELLNFYYTGFGFMQPLDIHPSYFGMYILLALSVLLFEKFQINNFLKGLLFILLSTSILFINSRVILFLYLMIVLIYVLKRCMSYFKRKTSAILSFLVISILLLLSFYAITKTTYIYESLTKEALWDLSFNVGEKYNSKTLGDSRLARWSVAVDLIREKPFFGYGLGKEKDILEMGFQNQNMIVAAQNRYDAHNQFLGYSIELGLFGLAALLYYFFTSAWVFYKSQNVIYLLFIINVFAICLFEDYLNNNAGVIFVAFYANLFLLTELLAKPKQMQWTVGR